MYLAFDPRVYVSENYKYAHILL